MEKLSLDIKNLLYRLAFFNCAAGADVALREHHLLALPLEEVGEGLCRVGWIHYIRYLQRVCGCDLNRYEERFAVALGLDQQLARFESEVAAREPDAVVLSPISDVDRRGFVFRIANRGHTMHVVCVVDEIAAFAQLKNARDRSLGYGLLPVDFVSERIFGIAFALLVEGEEELRSVLEGEELGLRERWYIFSNV